MKDIDSDENDGSWSMQQKLLWVQGEVHWRVEEDGFALRVPTHLPLSAPRPLGGGTIDDALNSSAAALLAANNAMTSGAAGVGGTGSSSMDPSGAGSSRSSKARSMLAYLHGRDKFNSAKCYADYDMDAEFTRQGILTPESNGNPNGISNGTPNGGEAGVPTALWRVTDENKMYRVCASYPHRIVVPANIRDSDLTATARWRSINRLPVLTWLNPRTKVRVCLVL